MILKKEFHNFKKKRNSNNRESQNEKYRLNRTKLASLAYLCEISILNST